MLAKRFFYISAALLCLAAAYHLGAVNARAQAGSVDIASTNETYGTHAAVVGRTVYVAYWGNEGMLTGHRVYRPSRVRAWSSESV